jgi:quercetin dioxygenase-like cupin family protein
MKLSKLSEVPRQSMSRATKFFHGAEHVSRQGLTEESKEVSVNIIHFDHGAHTRMHIHGCDQVLLVTKGKGFVETEQARHELAEGDVVFAPAGEKHRHGALDGKEQRLHAHLDYPPQFGRQVLRRLARPRARGLCDVNELVQSTSTRIRRRAWSSSQEQ